MSWRLASRTLGALLAGSAVMFAAAVLRGGTLLTHEDGGQAAAEPLPEPTVRWSSSTGAISAGQAVAVSVAVVEHAAPVAPGATSGRRASSVELPARLISAVQTEPQQLAPDPAVTAADHQGHGDIGFRGDASARSGEQQGDSVVGDVLGYFVQGFTH